MYLRFDWPPDNIFDYYKYISRAWTWILAFMTRIDFSSKTTYLDNLIILW